METEELSHSGFSFFVEKIGETDRKVEFTANGYRTRITEVIFDSKPTSGLITVMLDHDGTTSVFAHVSAAKLQVQKKYDVKQGDECTFFLNQAGRVWISCQVDFFESDGEWKPELKYVKGKVDRSNAPKKK